MGIVGIDHVQLAAPPGCEDQARWFFVDVLQLSEIAKPPELARRGGCWFQCGSQQIHIGVEPGFIPARKAHPAFSVDDLPSLMRRFQMFGVAFETDTADLGVQRIFAADPWGNRLEFVQKR